MNYLNTNRQTVLSQELLNGRSLEFITAENRIFEIFNMKTEDIIEYCI